MHSDSVLGHESGPCTERQTRRSRQIRAGRDWKCKYCQREYFSKGSLVSHLNAKHLAKSDRSQYIAALRKLVLRTKLERELMQAPVAFCESQDSYLSRFSASTAAVDPIDKFDIVFRTIFSDNPLETRLESFQTCGLYIHLV